MLSQNKQHITIDRFIVLSRADQFIYYNSLPLDERHVYLAELHVWLDEQYFMELLANLGVLEAYYAL